MIGMRWIQNGKTYDGIFEKPLYFGDYDFERIMPKRMIRGDLKDLETEFGALVIHREIDYYYYSLKANYPECTL